MYGQNNATVDVPGVITSTPPSVRITEGKF